MKKILHLFLLGSTFLSAAQSLDEIARKYGTDKSSGFRRVGGAPGHNYAHIYEQYFYGMKDKSIKLLEIGFEFGLSAHMWDEYFTKGTLYFIDNYEPFFKYGENLSAKCHLHVLDQSNIPGLQAFIDRVGGDFDIIIDDGSHRSEHQITSFKQLFPHLKSGGLYVIEDLHAAYWKEYGGNGTKQHPQIGENSIMLFLFSLVHDINQVGARTGCASKHRCPSDIFNDLNYYQRNIRTIHFYDSMCFIIKN